MNNQETSQTEDMEEMAKPAINKRLSVILFIFVAIFAGFTIWRSLQQSTDQEFIQPYSEADIESLLQTISERIDLPDEVPLIAKVENAAALKVDQPFYDDVQNGDIVLLFATKAVIYRPDEDIIINVGPLLYVDPDKLDPNFQVN
ncbi:MAG: hypothetical protein ACPGO5_00350 [Patescibacteria group bacterium]